LVTGPFLDAVHLAELLEPEREMCIKRKNTDIIFIVIVDVVVIIVNIIVLIIDNNIITIIIYICKFITVIGSNLDTSDLIDKFGKIVDILKWRAPVA